MSLELLFTGVLSRNGLLRTLVSHTNIIPDFNNPVDFLSKPINIKQDIDYVIMLANLVSIHRFIRHWVECRVKPVPNHQHQRSTSEGSHYWRKLG